MNIDWTIMGVVLTGIGVIIAYKQLVRTPKLDQDKTGYAVRDNDDDNETGRPSAWSGIMPKNTKYRPRRKKFNSLPGGPQTITLEYDPEGHGHPLNLKGSVARLEIQFTCQIKNAMKAVTAGNEYAMNFLPAHFLTKARIMLEANTLKRLIENREIIAKEILDKLSPYFEEFGFELQHVSIGAISKI